MTYKDILSPSGAPTEYFNQQPFYEWIKLYTANQTYMSGFCRHRCGI